MKIGDVINSIEHEAFESAMNPPEPHNGQAYMLCDKKNISKINEILKKGNSVEIHPAKEGIKIYEVRKKIICENTKI